jgi:hypothetical protein
MSDKVNNPGHYGGADNPYETIKVLRAWLTPEEFVGFLKGNALKYLSRHRQKGGLEDLKKAQWYQNALVEFENVTEVLARLI